MQLAPPKFQAERFHRGRVRPEVFNPITGTYSAVPQNLKTDNNASSMYFSPVRKTGKVERVAGALRKPVETNYVNPFAIKYAHRDPELLRAAACFYDN